MKALLTGWTEPRTTGTVPKPTGLLDPNRWQGALAAEVNKQKGRVSGFQGASTTSDSAPLHNAAESHAETNTSTSVPKAPHSSAGNDSPNVQSGSEKYVSANLPSNGSHGASARAEILRPPPIEANARTQHSALGGAPGAGSTTAGCATGASKHSAVETAQRTHALAKGTEPSGIKSRTGQEEAQAASSAAMLEARAASSTGNKETGKQNRGSSAVPSGDHPRSEFIAPSPSGGPSTTVGTTKSPPPGTRNMTQTKKRDSSAASAHLAGAVQASGHALQLHRQPMVSNLPSAQGVALPIAPGQNSSGGGEIVPPAAVPVSPAGVPVDNLPAHTAALTSRLAAEGGGETRITLHPADLGTITLSIFIAPSGALSVRMVAEKAAGLQAAVAAAGGMSQHLSQAGFQVSSVQASQGARDASGSFTDSGSSSNHGHHQPQPYPSDASAESAAKGEPDQSVVAYA